MGLVVTNSDDNDDDCIENAKLTSTFVDVPNKISILEDQRKYWPRKTKVSN